MPYKKDKRKTSERNLKTKKYIFYKKSFQHETTPKNVAMLLHRKDTKKTIEMLKNTYFL